MVVYTSLGGLISVVRNDLFQGGFLLAGIIALFFWLLIKAGQTGNLTQLEAASLPFFGLFSNFKTNGLAALSFTLAWLISPIAWQRVYAARDLAEARKGLLLTAAIFTLFYPLISFVGILGQPFSGFKAGDQTFFGLADLAGTPVLLVKRPPFHYYYSGNSFHSGYGP